METITAESAYPYALRNSSTVYRFAILGNRPLQPGCWTSMNRIIDFFWILSSFLEKQLFAQIGPFHLVLNAILKLVGNRIDVTE